MPWALVDYPVVRRQSSPCTTQGGSVSIVLDPVPVGYAWRVDGIVVFCPNTSGDTVTVTVYDRPPEAGVVPCQGTHNANFDVDDQASPITVQGGDQLTFVFTNVDVGAIASVRVQYQLMQGQPAAPRAILT